MLVSLERQAAGLGAIGRGRRPEDAETAAVLGDARTRAPDGSDDLRGAVCPDGERMGAEAGKVDAVGAAGEVDELLALGSLHGGGYVGRE